MTEEERNDWQRQIKRLPPEHAAQWTEQVFEEYLKLKKARRTWKRINGLPSDVLGSVKPEGQLTPLFIPNDAYLLYQAAQQEWTLRHEPVYIKEERARMSKGDFEETDDWNLVS